MNYYHDEKVIKQSVIQIILILPSSLYSLLTTFLSVTFFKNVSKSTILKRVSINRRGSIMINGL